MRRTTTVTTTAVKRLAAVATAAAAVLSGAAVLGTAPTAVSAAPPLTALPKADCGPGSRPEPGLAGRAPAADFASGRAQRGYTCNARIVGRAGSTGGFKVHRYTDRRGRTCAYYDLARTFPLGVTEGGLEGSGTAVLDLTDPRRPVRTATLTTPAMQSPHESLFLHARRGLRVAVMGNLLTAPGVLDVYDVSADCREPRLVSSTPSGFLGHESGFSPDGRTFWASGLVAHTITAIDLTDPRTPVPVGTIHGVLSHGLRTSPDGRTLYVADLGRPEGDRMTTGGLRIYDVGAIQDREPGATARLLSTYTWPDLAIPQVAEPMRIKGRDYVLAVDEFTELPADMDVRYDPARSAGIARIIDVEDPEDPFQVSALRLQVHLERHRRGPQQHDPGADSPLGGYTAHYCGTPRFRDPGLVACSYIASGLRVFDVRDPYRPREVAYVNKPAPGGANALSRPAFDVPRKQVWFADAASGFYAVRIADRVWPKGLR